MGLLGKKIKIILRDQPRGKVNLTPAKVTRRKAIIGKIR